MRVLTTPNQQRMKFDKILKNFDLCWKFGSKMRFLTTLDLRRMKFDKIQKFLVALKIWLKLWEFWPLPTSKGWNLTKSRKILICVENLAQKWAFWPQPPDLRWMKFGKIQKFSVALKIWLEIESLTAPAWPSKDEILQNQEISIRVKNLAQNWDFWPLRTCEGWNLAKFRNF